MANLVRLKQLDQPELSGYILDVTDQSYYPSNNPSGYISDLLSDNDFVVLSGNLATTGSILSSGINSSGAALSGLIISSGSFLDSKIDTLSGYVEVSNLNIATVSGNTQYAINLITGFEVEVSGVISGEVSGLVNLNSTTSGALDTKINNVSGNLGSRITVLENNFATTGSNFVDLNSNNQTIEGSKTFNNKIGFKQIDILPYTGNYSNPGGQHGILFTQFIDNYSFAASGLGTITGDAFITKIMQPNNIECIISSIIYTGSY
jgi:hypothetical protein